MEYPCIENTIDLDFTDHLVRLWINKDRISQDFILEEQIVSAIKQFYQSSGMSGRESLINRIVKLPDVNAVQVIEKKEGVRYGTVVYTVNFDSKG